MDQYRTLLRQFPTYAQPGWREGGAGLTYFGDGSSHENGLRTQGSVAFTCALLASDASIVTDAARREEMRRRFCDIATYMTRTHRTGDRDCAAGGRWGSNWQSAWWTTRLAVGAMLVWDTLDEPLRAALQRVIVAEADHHLPRRCPTGLVEDTKAEENAWDAEVLAVAHAMFPQHAHAPRWLEKAREFWMNTLSIPSDRTSDALCDGKPLREQVYTVNLYEDFTLDNHGAYHFCYVASPLQSIAWARYALQRAGIAIPESQMHHVREVWNRAKPLFLDNRFAYVAGKDWARYTYGQYFIVPVLAMLQHEFADAEARAIELRRVERLAWEQRHNGDGSFFGKRVTRRVYRGQNAKYESDCFACVGLAYLMHQLHGTPIAPIDDAALSQHLTATHISPECSVAYARTPRAFASFSWHTLRQDLPNLQFIPAGCDDLAEWGVNNLLGQVRTFENATSVGVRTMTQTDHGFIITGDLEYRGEHAPLFGRRLRVEVDAARGVALVDNHITARRKLRVRDLDALCFWIANDIFNDCTRTLHFEGQSITLAFDPGFTPPAGRLARLRRKVNAALSRETSTQSVVSRWANVDGRFGIIQLDPTAQPFVIRRSPTRDLAGGSIHCEILSLGDPQRLARFARGQTLIRSRVLIVAGTADQTAALARTLKPDLKTLDDVPRALP